MARWLVTHTAAHAIREYMGPTRSIRGTNRYTAQRTVAQNHWSHHTRTHPRGIDTHLQHCDTSQRMTCKSKLTCTAADGAHDRARNQIAPKHLSRQLSKNNCMDPVAAQLSCSARPLSSAAQPGQTSATQLGHSAWPSLGSMCALVLCESLLVLGDVVPNRRGVPVERRIQIGVAQQTLNRQQYSAHVVNG